MKVTDQDIKERLAEYQLALKTEKQASPRVRRAWTKLVAMLEELLQRRGGDR